MSFVSSFACIPNPLCNKNQIANCDFDWFEYRMLCRDKNITINTGKNVFDNFYLYILYTLVVLRIQVKLMFDYMSRSQVSGYLNILKGE